MERAVVIDAMPGEVWEAQGKCVFRGRDPFGPLKTHKNHKYANNGAQQ